MVHRCDDPRLICSGNKRCISGQPRKLIMGQVQTYNQLRLRDKGFGLCKPFKYEGLMYEMDRRRMRGSHESRIIFYYQTNLPIFPQRWLYPQASVSFGRKPAFVLV